MTWAVSRLGKAEQVVEIQVGKELQQNYFVDDFGQEWMVWTAL